MAPYIVGFTLLAVVFSIIIEIFAGRLNKIIATVTIAAFTSLVFNWVVIFFLNPTFSHWLTGGYAWLIFLNLIIATAASFFASVNESDNPGAAVGTFLTVVIFLVYTVITAVTPPAWCDTEAIRERIKLLNIQDAPAGMTYPETRLDQLIKVPASAALTRAGEKLSGGENATIGNYLQPNRAYLQLIYGIPYYVIDLKVTDWWSYRQAGEFAPGYILVNAIDPNAEVEIRFDHTLKYVPGGRFSLDLDRAVYFNYLLGSNYFIEDLDGMEVNDTTPELTPNYTGTVLEHVMGYQGTLPTRLYQFDPATGYGQEILISEISEKAPWIDRVYPLSWVKEGVELWGSFSTHEACSGLATTNMSQIDSYADVITSNGVEYQFTMTGIGDDPSITKLITYDAKRGFGYAIPFEGKTIFSIREKFAKLSTKILPAGLTVDECEVHYMDGRNTAYCMLTNTQDGDTSTGAYGFVDINNAGDDANYAIAENLNDAWNMYLTINSEADEMSQITNTANDITIKGIVKSNELVISPETSYRMINVIGDDNVSYWFMPDAGSKNAAAATEGRRVTIVAYQREGQEFMNVRHITVEGEPDFGNSISAAIEYLKNLFGK